ncbi:Sacsin, partial [Dissostichus eleginoides]
MSLNTKKKSRTSFGATAPPFIDYLQDILRRYPDGGQILKELIQNADDAKATEVVFIHDDRSYGTESLWTDELGKYQGPALYAYNNAAFTDEDWEGIQMAGRSVKRNDPNKVGRFGIGFNSVYHITDVPSIFSSDHLGMMDPQEKIFGQRNSDNRREIKWQEEDQQHDEHAVWNELLMKEVLPQAYIMIIQDAINLAQQDNLPVSSVQNVAVLSLAKDEREFITPSEAVFPCSVASAIVEAYPHLDTLKHVTPAFIRGSLRRIDVHTISKPDKLCLLEFILSDEKYRELEGLQLLPLNDGSFRSFTDREEDTALIDSNEFPRVLLPFCKHLFIPDNLRPACSAHLKELARENIFKVINIDAKRVAEYTKRFLPQDWKQMSKGHVTWDKTIEETQQPFASSSEVKVSIEILKWLWKEKKTVQDDIPVPVLIEELVGIEQFGQSEPITTRIKNILKEYDEERDIFKEIIQNAEDAGAEACKFLVDLRVHKDSPESLIDPDMAL